jgi:hypothetical protein
MELSMLLLRASAGWRFPSSPPDELYTVSGLDRYSVLDVVSCLEQACALSGVVLVSSVFLLKMRLVRLRGMLKILLRKEEEDSAGVAFSLHVFIECREEFSLVVFISCREEFVVFISCRDAFLLETCIAWREDFSFKVCIAWREEFSLKVCIAWREEFSFIESREEFSFIE